MHSASSVQSAKLGFGNRFQTGPWKKHPRTGRLYRDPSPTSASVQFWEPLQRSVTPEMGDRTEVDRAEYDALLKDHQDLQDKMKDMQATINQLLFEKNLEAENGGDELADKPKTEMESQMASLLDRVKKMEVEHKPDPLHLSLYPEVSLPLNFKCPTFDDKFRGTGDPKTHLTMYVRMLKPLGATEENLAQLFQNSLADPARRWFLKQTKLVTWDQIVEAFLEEYKWSSEVETTRRELNTLRHEKGEPITDYVHRFQVKVSNMTRDRPGQPEVMDMICASLRPVWKKKMTFMTFHELKVLVEMGQKIEIAVKEGILKDYDEKSESESSGNGKGFARKNFSTPVNQVSSASSSSGAVAAAWPQSPRTLPNDVRQGQSNQGRQRGIWDNKGGEARPNRQFTHIPIPLSQVFAFLKESGKLQARNPTSAPPVGNLNHYCEYHQKAGHWTDNCLALRHSIEDLFDKGEVERPQANNPPANMLTNPHPRVNLVVVGGETEDATLCIMAEDGSLSGSVNMEQLGKKKVEF